jgi:hypothetical protein
MQSQDALARDWTEFLKADAGRPLDPQIRSHFEALLLTCLSHVRVHTGPLASEFARRLGARAFTFANHIVIGEGEYQPFTDPGFRLLAHELAHAVQQQGQQGTPCGVGDPDSAWEIEAELAAEQVIRGTSPCLTHDPHPVIRRVITIDRSSAKLTVTTRPTVNAPAVASPLMRFTSGGIRATGEVSLNGVNLLDIPIGWSLGFIQAQWIETNWVHYRGQRNNHGSLFLQRARPPARPAQACRDTLGPVGDIFYDTQIGRGLAPALIPVYPLKLSASFADFPSESANLIETNGLTGQPNFIRECQLEFHFCTILVVRDPAGTFHQLKFVYWNLHWQARFLPTNFASALTTPWNITLVAGGNAGNLGPVSNGAVGDKRFTGVLTSPQTQNCNQVFRAAVASPNRTESRVWTNFDVRR